MFTCASRAARATGSAASRARPSTDVEVPTSPDKGMFTTPRKTAYHMGARHNIDQDCDGMEGNRDHGIRVWYDFDNTSGSLVQKVKAVTYWGKTDGSGCRTFGSPYHIRNQVTRFNGGTIQPDIWYSFFVQSFSAEEDGSNTRVVHGQVTHDDDIEIELTAGVK